MRRADRQGLIRLIHVAKKDLQLDDETYRSILMRIGKKDSSSNLTVPELEKVLEYLKRSGFKVRSKPKSDAKAKAKLSRPLAQDLESKKVRALWLFLHQLGAVKNPSEEALAAYVKRIAKVDDLRWARGRVVDTAMKPSKLSVVAYQFADWRWQRKCAVPLTQSSSRQSGCHPSK